MGREIRFRGKRLDNGEWVVGSLIMIEDTYFIIEPLDLSYDNNTDTTCFWFDCTKQEVDPATVGQYTGRNDYFDRPIFESDLLVYAAELYEVFFEEGSFYIIHESHDVNSLMPLHDVVRNGRPRIVGNVHDNPTLMKTNSYGEINHQRKSSLPKV